MHKTAVNKNRVKSQPMNFSLKSLGGTSLVCMEDSTGIKRIVSIADSEDFIRDLLRYQTKLVNLKTKTSTKVISFAKT